MSKSHKTGLRTIQLSLVVIIVVLGYLFWSLARPYNPADVTEPIVVKNKIVKKGEPIVLSLSTCTYKKTDARLEVELIGENSEAAIPLFTINNIPTTLGCQNDMLFPVPTNQLPFAMPTGKYRVRLHVTYLVNNYRNVTENYDSEVFEYRTE